MDSFYFFDKKPVYIYGTGLNGRELFKLLEKKGVLVESFIVSDDMMEYPLFIESIPVIKLTDWCVRYGHCGYVLVAVSLIARETILRNLQRHGITEYLYISAEVLCSLRREIFPVDGNRFLSDLQPVSRQFGFDRGMPIDRYYIDQFLNKQIQLLRKYLDFIYMLLKSVMIGIVGNTLMLVG